MSATLANQLLQRWPGTLVNLYGPTEATIEVTFAMVTGALERVMVPIGRPLDNVRLLVLGPALQLCPRAWLASCALPATHWRGVTMRGPG
nr:amino acid adenylation domain-containing protein [Pseudomonas sp. BIGb0427]